MSEHRTAASLSWYVRHECMRLGSTIRDRLIRIVSETADPTMLKPPMRLRRVRRRVALLNKIVPHLKAGSVIQPIRVVQQPFWCNCHTRDEPMQLTAKHGYLLAGDPYILCYPSRNG